MALGVNLSTLGGVQQGAASVGPEQPPSVFGRADGGMFNTITDANPGISSHNQTQMDRANFLDYSNNNKGHLNRNQAYDGYNTGQHASETLGGDIDMYGEIAKHKDASQLSGPVGTFGAIPAEGFIPEYGRDAPEDFQFAQGNGLTAMSNLAQSTKIGSFDLAGGAVSQQQKGMMRNAWMGSGFGREQGNSYGSTGGLRSQAARGAAQMGNYRFGLG
tara:strand:+ start:280 stop:930 length:651 start_codon:yes stop_codon:yes gene_type:complete